MCLAPIEVDVTSPLKFCIKYHTIALSVIGLGLVWLMDDTHVAKSVVLGGLIYTIPNLYFVHYAFRFQGATQVPLVLRSFSWGESGKFTLAAMGFVLAFRFVESLSYAAMFAGFITMMALQCVVAVRLVSKRDEHGE